MSKFFKILLLIFLSLSNFYFSPVLAEEKIKIGLLVPTTGDNKHLGQQIIKSARIALKEIGSEKIEIYLKDTNSDPNKTLKSATELKDMGIKVVIGPIFYESLERLNEINNITFISFTNKTQNIPKNTIAFGINIESQIEALKKYFSKIKVSKTILLSPKSVFVDQSKLVTQKDILKFYRTYKYDTDPKKITGAIEKITNYRERKKDLERRIKILEKSDLFKHKEELKTLEQRHTLGEVNFDSVVIIDFGESLKSVLTSFVFSDVSSEEVRFFTVNQWFDKSFFNENALLNLHFPAINLKNFNKFNKKFKNTFNKSPNEISILAYDALGLVYHCWHTNNFQFKKNQLFNKKGFKGMHGKFFIEDNISKQKLKIYKVSDKKFVEVY